MKRICIILFSIIQLLLISSCSQDVKLADSASVCFEDKDKSITSVVENTGKANLFWKYASKHVDESAASGQTESYDESGSVFIHENVPGLDGTVDGFDPGTWNFKLFGFSRSGDGTVDSPYQYALVYSGEIKGVVLKKGEKTSVVVPVSPITDGTHGNGTLFVDLNNITFDAKQSEESNVGENNLAVIVTPLEDDTEIISGINGIYSVLPGKYKVNLTYSIGDYKYATATVVATIYANQITRVSGKVTELVTFVSIDISDD